MVTKTTFLALLLAAASAAPEFAQSGDIHALRCHGCSDPQFEQAAIGAGLGKRWLYDFAGGELRAYLVGREPNGTGGFFYEAVPLPVEAVYQTLFDRAWAVYRGNGSLSKSVVLTLAGAPATGGHSDDSVFTLFNSDVGMGRFNTWLAQYMAQQGIPVSPDASEIQTLIVSNPTIKFAGDYKRVGVRVIFKDGQAQFELEDDEAAYRFKPGSAWDSDGRKIPESPSQIGQGEYRFPHGEQSQDYQNYLSLIRYWGVPIGNGGWICTEVTGGGSVERGCRLGR